MKNIIGTLIVVTMLSSSLTGCNIYSNYQRSTDTEEVDSLYNYIESTNDTTNISSLPWRELFTDTILQSHIEQALENNTSLNVARLNVDQAQIALKSARLAFLPSVNAVPQGNLTSFNGSTSQTYNLSVSASWEIDVFGKLRNAKERSKSALEHSVAYRQAVQTQLIATVANTYYSLLMLDNQLDISMRTKDNWQENIRAVTALKNAGKMNQISVFQAEANKIALTSHVIKIERQIKDLENSFSSLLAINPQHINRGTLAKVTFPTELSVGVPIQLLTNRPDIRVAEHNLAQMFYATNEARSALYPSITLGGAAGFSNSAGAILNPATMIYNAVVSIMQPIFNGGMLRAQVKISESKQEQAMLQFQQAILDAAVEVNTALIQWQSATERLDHETLQLEILEKAVSGSQLLMKYGSATYMEVLIAQLSLLQTELTYSTTKFDEIQGVINLYRALGGGEK